MKKWIYNIMIILFSLVFLGSSGMLAYYFIDGGTQEAAYNELSQIRQDALQTPDKQSGSAASQEPPLSTVTDPETGEEFSVLTELSKLYELNPDLVGWISIPGTKIDYPVLQKPKKHDYYLRRDFYGKKATAGSIYVEEGCDVTTPSDNVTIYGHMMKNGTMFADLKHYKKKDFWQENKIIQFSNLDATHEYEIFAVFVTSAIYGKGFIYHDFIFAKNQAQFDKFVSGCRKHAIYDTGIVPQYGDKLITLSTCDYSIKNGRLVVVARRVN